jgi:hypothetical protein
MEVKPYQMVEAVVAILQCVSMSLKRGAITEHIIGAIVREGDAAQGFVERNVKWYVACHGQSTIWGPFTSQEKAEEHGQSLGHVYMVSRIYPPAV